MFLKNGLTFPLLLINAFQHLLFLLVFAFLQHIKDGRLICLFYTKPFNIYISNVHCHCIMTICTYCTKVMYSDHFCYKCTTLLSLPHHMLFVCSSDRPTLPFHPFIWGQVSLFTPFPMCYINFHACHITRRPNPFSI